ncbi:hypothetical protein RND71_003185 [Anisodus tanguticus]|uniref:PRA1 family protein n=1 Tax=Anisodus tanguticus TaxID=243964 RepID=A0AAE1SU49_9SOLA|nr:hypothetical protein RND71_003185 [Anisodus tanguticus]
MSSSKPSDPSTASCTPNTMEKVLADGVPRKLAILRSTLFLSFVNYTGLTIVGYVGVALGVISLALGVISLGVALGVKNQQLKQELPPNLFARDVILSIASAVGRPIVVDKATHDRTRPGTARVKVEVELLRELQQRMRLQCKFEDTGRVKNRLRFSYDLLL